MNQFVVSARKYRPTQFKEVVGQEHITQTLKNAIRQQKLAHSFLFCGPRGVGKTTTARILAKAINCQDPGSEVEPCGKCESCVSFQNQNSMNILEMDGASNNSVENIRNLIEQVRIPPAHGDYKLFIIDEVHMLSASAFNAFLKTLEEPPSHAIFILATTEKHKILPTILSRCQIYDFKRIQVREIVSHLQSICQSENIDFEEEALHVIAEKADGALRDALSMFDRIASFAEGRLSYEKVIKQLNILDYDYYFKFVDQLMVGDLGAIYLLFDDVLSRGFDAHVFLLGLQEHFRQLLMIQLDKTEALVDAVGNLKEKYIRQAAQVERDFILTALDLANACDVNYRMAQNKRLHVEIALMKIAYFKNVKATRNDLNEISEEPAKKKVNPVAGNESQNISVESRENDVPEVPTVKSEPDQKATEKISVEGAEKRSIQKGIEKRAPTPVKKQSAGKHVLPKLNNLSNIKADIEKENNKGEAVKDNEVLKAEINASWKEFRESHSSPSLRSFMEDSLLELVGDQLIVRVSSQLAKSSILEQRELFENIRSVSGPRNIQIKFEIEESESQDESNESPLITPQDKFNALREKNPKLDMFVKTLNLKIDSD